MPTSRGEPRRRRAAAALIVFSGLATAAFRFLAASFNNDHFVHLIAARQMLSGDWPTRDFLDVGRPLLIVASAGAQWLLGPTLFAEAILVSIAFGMAAALTALVVWVITRSLWAAWAAVLIEVLAFPRTYAFPKLLALALGLLVIVHYIRTPTWTRQLLMAVGTAVGFLFRHDLGLYIGIGGLLASLVSGPRTALVRGARFAALCLALVAPYLAYVHVHAGLPNHFALGAGQYESEEGYVWPNPLALDGAWESQLVYAFYAVPVAVALVCAKVWSRGAPDWTIRFLFAAAAVALTADIGLIRDVLRVRLVDAVVPVVVLGAWLGHRVWQVGGAAARTAVIAVVLAAGLAIGDMADAGERLSKTELVEHVAHPWSLPSQFAERAAELRQRFSGDWPSRTAMALHPFFLYLDRCTTHEHRLFLGGLIPEVAYLAQRPFAGGAYEHYNFRSLSNQRRVVGWLRAERAPFALIPSASAREFENDAPLVAAYVQQRYAPLTEVPVDGEERVVILLDRTLPVVSRDDETGWPCFTAHTSWP
jgi:hypothetical protein